MENCLIIAWKGYQLGCPDEDALLIQIREYQDEFECLMAYCETPCYYSQIITKDMVDYIVNYGPEKWIEDMIKAEECL